MNKILEKIFFITFIVFFVLIIVATLLNTPNADLLGTRKLVPLFLIISIGLFGLLHRWGDKLNFSRWNQRSIYYLSIIYFVFLFLFSLYFMQDGYAETSWVYEGAKILANGDKILNNEYYQVKFSQFHYLKGILFVAAFFEKIAVILHINEKNFLSFINSVMIATTLPSTYYVCKKMFNDKIAWYSVSMLFVYLPIYFASCIFYNYTFVYAFPIGILALYVSLDYNKLCMKKLVAISFLAGFGYNIFSVCIIVLIAILIDIIVLKKNRVNKGILIGIFTLVFTLIFSAFFEKLYNENIYDERLYDAFKYPMLESTVYVGLNADTNGRFSVADEEYIKSFDNYEAKKQALQQQIVYRWEQMDLSDKFMHAVNKGSLNFGSGTYYTEWTSNDNLCKDRKLITFFSKDFDDVKFYRSFYTALNLWLLIGMCVSVFLKRDKSTLVPWLSIFGMLLITIITETNPRHVLPYFPFIVIMFAFSFEGILTKLEKHKR